MQRIFFHKLDVYLFSMISEIHAWHVQHFLYN